MTAAALLAKNPQPTPTDIDRWLAGNLCRCGAYNRALTGKRVREVPLSRAGLV